MAQPPEKVSRIDYSQPQPSYDQFEEAAAVAKSMPHEGPYGGGSPSPTRWTVWLLLAAVVALVAVLVWQF